MIDFASFGEAHVIFLCVYVYVYVCSSLVGKLYRRGENFSNTQLCFEHLKEEGVNAPDSEVLDVLNPKAVMMSYTSLGGTSAQSVKHILKEYRQQLDSHKSVLVRIHKRSACSHPRIKC